MTYQKILEQQLNDYRTMIDKLCDLRDEFKEKSMQYRYFQGQVDSLAAIKNEIDTNHNQARIEELEKELNK